MDTSGDLEQDETSNSTSTSKQHHAVSSSRKEKALRFQSGAAPFIVFAAVPYMVISVLLSFRQKSFCFLQLSQNTSYITTILNAVRVSFEGPDHRLRKHQQVCLRVPAA